MEEFDKYIVKGDVHVGDKFIIYRAYDAEGKTNIYLKAVRAEFPDLKDVAELQREYELIKELDSNEIIKSFGLAREEHKIALVLEDITGGNSLDNYIKDSSVDLNEFFDVSIKIVQGLMALHEKKIIHKDIKPSNIIYSRDSQILKIIDFNISTKLSYEAPEASSNNMLEGSLPYISPEQTGQVARGIDYRTDLYALGATLYELITQQRMFSAESKNDWIRKQICSIPKKPSEINPEIPEMISKIIMKLVEKDPRNRYQSLSVLRKDLVTCQVMYKTKGVIDNFEIAKNDISDIFIVSEKLFGREAESAELVSLYEEISNGGNKLVMVSGYAGVGKTALINEIKPLIIEKSGHYANGKFDQYQRHLPYAALIGVLKNIVKQILALPEQDFNAIKQEIQEKLHPNIQLIIDIVPTLKNITGEQPTLQELPDIESKNRFQFTIREFIKILAKKSHPLVIFLDDLQWSDEATLLLLKSILDDQSIESLLIICAYRDNEVDAAHPLSFFIDEVAKKQKITNLSLKPLAYESVFGIVAETLHRHDADTKSLAELIFSKTEGNPFYTAELLKTMYREEYISFNYADANWQWDMQRIAELPIQSNVVEFMIKRLAELPVATQDLLKIASCIGNKFDLKLLALTAEQEMINVASSLWLGLKSGIIIPIQGDYELAGTLDKKYDLEKIDFYATYQFLHDKIQQAAYHLIDDSEKPSIHLKVGHALLKHLKANEVDEQVVTIAGHLNKGASLIESPQEKLQLADLNLKAGTILRKSVAYKESYNYLKNGIKLLTKDSWSQHYNLAYNLYEQFADSAFLFGKHDESFATINYLLQNAKTDIEKAKIFRTSAMQNTIRGNLDEAIDLCYKGLHILGVDINKNPSSFEVIKKLLVTFYYIKKVSVNKIIDLDLMSDPKKIIAMQLLLEMSGPAYTTGNKNLLAIINLAQVIMSLRSGNTKESACAYAVLGLVLNSELGFFTAGYKFGKLGVELNKKLDDISLRCRIQFIYASFIAPWNEAVKDLQALFRLASISGYQSGDFVYVSYTGNLALASPTVNTLPETLKIGDMYYNIISETKFYDSLAIIKVFQQFNLYLIDLNDNKFFQLENELEKEFYERELKNNTMQTARVVFSVCKLRHYFIFNDYQNAYKNIISDEDLVALTGQSLIEEYYFFSALTLLKLYTTFDHKEKRQALQKIKQSYKKIKKWAKHCPTNFLHHKLLLEAELMRIKNKGKKARILYDEAIKQAQQLQYTNYEAIAAEVAADFYTGEEKLKYLKKAHYSYLLWGATAKVKQLEDLHQLN